MECPRVVPLSCPDENAIGALFEGALPAQETSRIDAHVDACLRCQKVLAGLASLFASRPSSTTGSAPRTGRIEDDGRLARGSAVGRYVVFGYLGAGSMGVVYAAFDPELGRKVALKFVQSTDGGGQAVATRAHMRLRREARAIAGVSHPNVVGVYDVDTYGDRIFITMELIDGVSVRAWRAETHRSPREVLAVFLAAGRGLAAAHAAGIVHRDFKPDNVMIAKDGAVKVVDFGLARTTAAPTGPDIALSLDEAARIATPTLAFASKKPGMAGSEKPSPSSLRTGEVLGTPAYMAPEVRSGEAASALSDQYSFCAALHETLYGALPGVGVSGDTGGRDAVPSWLNRALRQGLGRPEDRYPTMGALLHALESKPRQRRRQGAAAFAVVAASLLGAAAYSAERVHVERIAGVCAGSERHFAGVWDTSRKGALESAFASTGLPYSEHASTQVEQTLDRYARDWAAMHTNACEATRLRGEQSEAVLDARMRCLDRHMAEARALVDVFASADKGVVAHAVQAAQRLAPVSECAVASDAWRKEPAGASPTSDSRLGIELASSDALRVAGKYEDASRKAQSILDAARESEQPSLQAEALYLLGRIAMNRHDWIRGRQPLVDAFVIADRIGADGLAAGSAIALGTALGLFQDEDKSDESDTWFRIAGAKLARVGGDDRLNDDLVTQRAQVLARRGKRLEAIEDLRRAIQAEEQKWPLETDRLSLSWNILGVALANENRSGEAEAALERALALYEHDLGLDHPHIANVLFNLSYIAASRGLYENARAYAERALALEEQSNPGGAYCAMLRCLLGSVLTLMHQFDEAGRELLRARSLAEGLPTFPRLELARIDWALGDLARAEKHYDEAWTDFRRAQPAIDESVEPADAPGGSGDFYRALGILELERGRLGPAAAALEKAIGWLGENTAELAFARMALARTLWQAGNDHERAKMLARQAKDYFRAAPGREGEIQDIERWLEEQGVLLPASP